MPIIAAYAWHEPTTWTIPQFSTPSVARLLSPLLPAVWLFIIARVVQAESLVGERQFWLTRPYEWRKLLTAKLLFILFFVNIPLLLLEVFLLIKAGYSPARHVLGLLYLQFLWSSCIFLPAMALAVVTAGIGQYLLGALSLMLSLYAGASLDSVMPNTKVAPDWFIDWLDLGAAVAAAVAVILWQYSRRRTVQSRFLVAGGVAFLVLTLAITPYRTLIDHTYQNGASASELPQIRFDSVTQISREGGAPEKNRVHIRLPLLVWGVTNGSIVQVDGTRVSIQASRGLHWASDWDFHNDILWPDHPRSHTEIAIDRLFFEQVKLVRVKLHVSFALTQFQWKDSMRIVAHTTPFTAPGEGRCSFIQAPSSEFSCLFPLRKPYLFASAFSEDSTCPADAQETPLPPGTLTFGRIFSQDSSLAEFDITPIQTARLSLSDWNEFGSSSPRLCPGTPLTFTIMQVSHRARRDLEIDGILLANYQLNDSM